MEPTHVVTDSTTSFYVQSKPFAPGAISGPTVNLCNSSGKVYSITAVTVVATPYTWTSTFGSNYNKQFRALSITVSFGGSSSSSGNITVKANNSCGSSALSLRLAVSAAPAQPGNISGNISVCDNQYGSSLFYCFGNRCTPSYTWTITGGATF